MIGLYDIDSFISVKVEPVQDSKKPSATLSSKTRVGEGREIIMSPVPMRVLPQSKLMLGL